MDSFLSGSGESSSIMTHPLMTIPEVADLLRISDKTVYRMCERDVLPHARVGLKGAIRVPREAVEKYVNDQLAAVAGE